MIVLKQALLDFSSHIRGMVNCSWEAFPMIVSFSAALPTTSWNSIEMKLKPNLCYTIALDRPGQDVHRRMARLLVTSLIRTGWHGRIVVFRNSSEAVLPVRHPAVEEMILEENGESPWGRLMQWKYRVRDLLDLTGIGKVLFLDCDSIALRSLNHLMLGTWDIYSAPEPGRICEPPFNGYLREEEMGTIHHLPGLNAGTLGVSAQHFRAVAAEWDRIDSTEPLRKWHATDQPAWNRLVLDTPLRHRHFAPGEVQFPFLHRAVWHEYRHAALVHACDRSPEEKFSLLYGLWMDVYGRDQFDRVIIPGHPL